MKTSKLVNWVSVVLLGISAGQAWAATPPELVNFEGVLRDATGNPENGTKDMTFHFYDTDGGGGCPAAGGTLLLTDEHLNAGTGNVTVADGLFNVPLGSGNVVAGSETSLGEVFRDNAAVYVEIEINTEVLCPRIRVTSAGYSLNAAQLNGVDASGFLDTSAAEQTKAGDLNVADLTVNGGDVFGVGGGILTLGSDLNWLRNDSDTDDFFLYAGNNVDDGGLAILGQGDFNLYSGSGFFSFHDGVSGSTQTALLDGLGNLQIDGDLTVSDWNVFGAPGSWLELGPDLNAIVNNADADDLYLFAGDTQDDGSIIMMGNGSFDMSSGNGTFQFLNGAAGNALTSSLDASGNLQTVGAVTAQELHSLGDLFINSDGPNGDSYLYFFDGGSPTNEWLTWNRLDDQFELSDDLRVIGLQSENDIRLGTGIEGSVGIYFFEDGSASGERFYWNDPADAFYVTDGFYATGELRTLASQIVINDDGPNGNQDIEFYNNGSQAERFQWDNGNQQFEVSDHFFVHGNIDAVGTKDFVQNHPHRKDLEIVYTALEGNEVATFTRGTARLRGGEARIELEESFRYVTNPELGLTVHLTARGGRADLYTASISTHELVVRSDDSDDAAFDFIVYGLRIGYEDRPVYRPKRAEAFLPLPGEFDEEIAAEPDRIRHTAAHRHRQMQRGALDAEIESNGAADALREAIGMREPGLDYPRGSEIPVREMNRRALEAEERDRQPAKAEHPSEESSQPNTATDDAPVTPQPEERRDIYARSFRPSAGDIARLVPVHEPVEAGDVLVIDAAVPGSARLARVEADTAVFGVVASEPGVVLGASDAAGVEDGATEVPVAVSGVVWCKADASWGAIRPGDLLQTSPIPGHAMRADDPTIGGVLGKALDSLDVGAGLIRVLVTLR